MNLREFKESQFASSPHLLLVGNPVSYSLSPVMHNAAAEYYGLPLRYHAVRVDTEDMAMFSSYLSHDKLVGLNVTIPHKRRMLDYVDVKTDLCQRIGALNTVVKRDGKLEGHNTDVGGFCGPLNSFRANLKDACAIVFGTGGAARAVVSGLKMLDMADIFLVSRNPSGKTNNDWPEGTQIISYEQWRGYASEATLLVNTTPLGMSPDTNRSPVKEEGKSYLAGKICYDIIYTPLETTFLRRADEAGATTISGLDMFINQGSRSFELWTGKQFPVKLVRKELMKHYSDAN